MSFQEISGRILYLMLGVFVIMFAIVFVGYILSSIRLIDFYKKCIDDKSDSIDPQKAKPLRLLKLMLAASKILAVALIGAPIVYVILMIYSPMSNDPLSSIVYFIFGVFLPVYAFHHFLNEQERFVKDIVLEDGGKFEKNCFS